MQDFRRRCAFARQADGQGATRLRRQNAQVQGLRDWQSGDMIPGRQEIDKKRKAGQQVRPLKTELRTKLQRQQQWNHTSCPVPCQSPVLVTRATYPIIHIFVDFYCFNF
jgi:hypothetical protein